MKLLIIFGFLCNYSYGQIYGSEYSNMGPDHGTARNFSGCDWNGVSHVLSELNTNSGIYSYVYHSEGDFRIFKKENDKFLEIANVSKTQMGESTRLLHVYEDSETINIFSWIPRGYNFVSFKKTGSRPFQLSRHVLIQNLNHCTLGYDPTVKSLQFDGPNQMRILKMPSEEYPETELLFEVRPDGVYCNGTWDKKVMDNEDSTVIDEKLKKDPDYYEKLRQAYTARLAATSKVESNVKQPNVDSSVPDPQAKINSTPVATSSAPSKPKILAPLVTRNSSSWFASLVALFTILLGCFGWWYFWRKARL